MKSLTIPNIAAVKAGEKTNLSAAEQWKEYFLKQEVTKTIVNISDIKKILGGISISEPVDTVVFVVLFPRSFRHLNDFLSELPSSSAMAIFFKNGNVVMSLNEELREMSYLTAWQQIVNRVTGTEFLRFIPEKPTENIEGLQKLQENHSKFQACLQGWTDAFNQIPGVKAEIYNDEIPGRLIEVCLLPGFPNDDSYEYWELDEANAVEDMCSDGDFSNIYEKWRKEIIAIKNLSWQEFYNRVVVLSQQYTTIPDLQTENM